MAQYLDKEGLELVVSKIKSLVDEEVKITNIEVNGTKQDIVDKVVNLFVPTKTSDLDNDSDFVGSDEVRNEIAEQIAEIVAGAPESLDTLKEIADWIEGHASDAAEMNSAIKQNASDIADILEQLANSSSLGFTYDEPTETLTFAGGFSVSYDEPTETLTI